MFFNPKPAKPPTDCGVEHPEAEEVLFVVRIIRDETDRNAVASAHVRTTRRQEVAVLFTTKADSVVSVDDLRQSRK